LCLRKLAPAVVWLARGAAHDVTGRVFHVDGGKVKLLQDPWVVSPAG
jgi:hypothetical protein